MAIIRQIRKATPFLWCCMFVLLVSSCATSQRRASRPLVIGSKKIHLLWTGVTIDLLELQKVSFWPSGHPRNKKEMLEYIESNLDVKILINHRNNIRVNSEIAAYEMDHANRLTLRERKLHEKAKWFYLNFYYPEIFKESLHADAHFVMSPYEQILENRPYRSHYVMIFLTNANKQTILHETMHVLIDREIVRDDSGLRPKKTYVKPLKKSIMLDFTSQLALKKLALNQKKLRLQRQLERTTNKVNRRKLRIKYYKNIFSYFSLKLTLMALDKGDEMDIDGMLYENYDQLGYMITGYPRYDLDYFLRNGAALEASFEEVVGETDRLFQEFNSDEDMYKAVAKELSILMLVIKEVGKALDLDRERINKYFS